MSVDTAVCNLSTMVADDITTSTLSIEYATDIFQDEGGLVDTKSKHDIVVQIMSK